MSLVVDVMSGGVRGGTSIMYAALGETVSERAGVINLGTEGSMLVGALSAYAIGVESGSPWLGALAGAAAGGLLAGLHAYLVVFRGASQFASGLSLLFLALGLTSLFGASYVGSGLKHGFRTWDVPVLHAIPAVGPILFEHDPLVYAGYLTVPLVWFVLFKTRIGLLARTAGERADSLTVHGYSVAWTRTGAVAVGGMLAGLGGAHLSIAYANAWFENMTAGRGFIALAALIFGMWRPWRVFFACLLFGLLDAVSIRLQGVALPLVGQAPVQLIQALPYALTVILLAGFIGRAVAPRAIGQPYVKEH